MAEIPFQRLGIPPEQRDKLKPGAPIKIKLAVAKGLLPIPPAQLVPMVYVLVGDKNSEVAAAARKTSTTDGPDSLGGSHRSISQKKNLMRALQRSMAA